MLTSDVKQQYGDLCSCMHDRAGEGHPLQDVELLIDGFPVVS